jgi:hypothetical protein
VLHDAHVRDWRSDDTRQYRWRYQYDSEYRIREIIRTQLRKAKRWSRIGESVRKALAYGCGGANAERLLGYTIADLKAHLEALFTNGMTWDEFHQGKIHIDHVIPKSSFDLTTINDLQRCWALQNLQPLWAADNMKKHTKIQGGRYSAGSSAYSGGSTPGFTSVRAGEAG